MPNNASDKDKKKKDKKKKTDPKPLHKEDDASQDSSPLSRSVAGKDESSLDLSFPLDRMEEAIQEHATGEAAEDSDSEQMKKVLRVEHSRAITVDERLAMRRKFRDEIRKANPMVSSDELKSLLNEAMLGPAIEWRRKQVQSAKDFLSLLPLGTVKKADALSSCAEPKTSIPLGMKKILTLTRDERVDVLVVTKDAYPDARRGAFTLKYKIALWEAHVKKQGGNPGRNLGNVDLSC
jgi:hypothetical protein